MDLVVRDRHRYSVSDFCLVLAGVFWGCCPSGSDDVASGSTADGVGAPDSASAEVATSVDFYRPTEPPAIEESDIVKSDGNWLYVLNQHTGLNVIDAASPRAPKLVARLDSLAGNGGELYLHDKELLVLARDSSLDCHAMAPPELALYPSTGIAVIQDPTSSPRVASERCVPGDLVTSRLAGDTLYVVTTAAPVEPGRGWLYAVDVASSKELEVFADLPLGGASFEVQMTSDALYVAESRPPETRIRVVDLSNGGRGLDERGGITISGSVPGRFHMDAQGSRLAVVTSDPTTDTNRLHVIDASNPDALALLGSLEGFAPGERLFATRFVGERAYVVTYQPEIILDETTVLRGSDPLWVISLENPSAPVVLGELNIPGWSDYIFPRGDLLLAVGRGDAGSQVAASLFDVSDPETPLELRRLEFGSATASSEASSDFRAVGIVEGELGARPLVVVPYADNIETEQGCVPEQHIQLIDVEERDLGLRGNLEQPGRVLRTLPLNGELMAVTTSAVTVNDVSRRDDPSLVASVAIGNPAIADECVLPPAAPQRIVTMTTVEGGEWSDLPDEGGEAGRLCMCSATPSGTPCAGRQVWTAVLVLAIAYALGRGYARTRVVS